MARPTDFGCGNGRRSLKLLNSFSGKKEVFEPANRDYVRWYCCGPTVYDLAHLGHARSYLAFDIMRRLLEKYFRYRVFYVMNITDIDDKIIKRARSWYLFEEYLNDQLRTYKLNGNVDIESVNKLVEKSILIQREKLKTITDIAKVEMIEKMVSTSQSALCELIDFFGKNNRDNSTCDKLKDILIKLKDLLADLFDLESGETVTDLKIFKSLAERYEKEFHLDMARLNILPPSKITRVSDYIDEIVSYVKKIESNGYAYQSNGSVYFDTDKFRAEIDPQNGGPKFLYPKLRPDAFGHKESLNEGEGELSVSVQEKRSSNNFALWKRSKPGEPRWVSDFGDGRPGWHIECSVMAHETCGPTLDIHSGGEDLKFPHHDNEIAQAEAHYNTGADWVKYFLHSGHLTISGCKMSKSLKNFITIREALEKYTSRQLRLLFLLHGWSDQLDYSQDTMQESLNLEKTFNEFFLNTLDRLNRASTIYNSSKSPDCDSEFMYELSQLEEKIDESLCDNLNTKQALFHCREFVNKGNKIMDKCDVDLLLQIALYLQEILSIFGCDFKSTSNFDQFSNSLSPVQASTHNTFGGDSKRIAYILAEFREKIRNTSKQALASSKSSENQDQVYLNLAQEQLRLCDELRDDILLENGIRFEDKVENGKFTTVVKFVDPIQAIRERDQVRQAKEELLNQKGKEIKKQQSKNEEKMLPPSEMFRVQTNLYSKFDDEGFPTHDFEGNEISDSKKKKLKKLVKDRERKIQALQSRQRNQS